jgi:hypothetical protein
MIADTMPTGPRRTAVAKAEVEVTVAQDVLNMAIDNRDWGGAVAALAQLREARNAVAKVLVTWIGDLPGAEEWANPKEKEARPGGPP